MVRVFCWAQHNKDVLFEKVCVVSKPGNVVNDPIEGFGDPLFAKV